MPKEPCQINAVWYTGWDPGTAKNERNSYKV